MQKIGKHRIFNYLLTALIAVGALIFSAACDSATDPPPPPPPMTLDIYPYGEIYEVDTGTNMYLHGKLTDEDGDPMGGYQVDLSIDPDTMGTITPYAVLDPTKTNGFNTQVVFNGQVNGVVLITGQVWIGDALSAQDTFHVWVRPPINE